MKRLILITLTASAAILSGCSPDKSTDADHLVILHTNDTHSAIHPDRHDKGGIARRQVLVDSVRNARENVLLVDAGDAVQGSLYFTLFGGQVEQKLMNALGYDIRILGNHEFDLGLDSIASQWKNVTSDKLSTNYDFTGTALEGLFVPSVMKNFNGHKVGFVGINLNPAGIISEENYKGMTYLDALKSANAEASKLKAEGAEMVIAVTHIGYELDDDKCDDLKLARGSKDIDVIIGGHSHTVVDPVKGVPAWRIANAEGDTVSVLQTGTKGVYVGEIDINLADKTVDAHLIPVDSRLDNRLDPKFTSLIDPYTHKVDSVKAIVVGKTSYDWERESPELLNLMSDFVRERGEAISGKPVDLSIMNKGGIRNSLSAGDITKGSIIDIAPFNNRIVVLELSGSDLIENLAIMAAQEGNGVSSNVKVLYDPASKQLNSATIDGKPIKPNSKYRVATIDYLAAGNDYMTPLSRGVTLAKSKIILYDELIQGIESGKMDHLLSSPDKKNRMASF